MRKQRRKGRGRGKACGHHQCLYTLKVDRVSITGVSYNGIEVPKGQDTCLHSAEPLLDLHTVKLAREGVVGKEDRFREMERGSEGVGGEWVSGDEGLDPCHCIFPNSIQLLQNGLSHQGSGWRNLGLLRCHRGYAWGNPGLLQLNGATVAALLQHFLKGPRLGPIAIKDLQNKHK